MITVSANNPFLSAHHTTNTNSKAGITPTKIPTTTATTTTTTTPSNYINPFLTPAAAANTTSTSEESLRIALTPNVVQFVPDFTAFPPVSAVVPNRYQHPPTPTNISYNP